MTTSIYATDDMPAMAVVTTTNAAMMNVPCFGRHRIGKDEVQHVAAALELVAGDGHVGKQNRDRPQHARRLVIARLQQIGQA